LTEAEEAYHKIVAFGQSETDQATITAGYGYLGVVH
jgi:tetratricopeptide (TPR) repeat protein